jgi:hypothetical protein
LARWRLHTKGHPPLQHDAAAYREGRAVGAYHPKRCQPNLAAAAAPVERLRARSQTWEPGSARSLEMQRCTHPCELNIRRAAGILQGILEGIVQGIVHGIVQGIILHSILQGILRGIISQGSSYKEG